MSSSCSFVRRTHWWWTPHAQWLHSIVSTPHAQSQISQWKRTRRWCLVVTTSALATRFHGILNNARSGLQTPKLWDCYDVFLPVICRNLGLFGLICSLNLGQLQSVWDDRQWIVAYVPPTVTQFNCFAGWQHNSRALIIYAYTALHTVGRWRQCSQCGISMDPLTGVSSVFAWHRIN